MLRPLGTFALVILVTIFVALAGLEIATSRLAASTLHGHEIETPITPWP